MTGNSTSRSILRLKTTYPAGLAIFLAITVSYAIGSAFLLQSDYISEKVIMAAAFDGVVVLPALFYMLCVRTAPLRKWWVALIAAAAGAYIYIWIPAEYDVAIPSAIRWVIPAIEIALATYLIFRLASIVKRYRSLSQQSQEPAMATLREALIPVLGAGALRELVMNELNVLYYALFMKASKPGRLEGVAFSYHKTSQFKTVSIVFAVIIVVETIALHFLLSMWSAWAAWISIALNIYGILYLTAASRSMGHLPHRFTKRHLHIHAGFPNGIAVPFSLIDRIVPAKTRGLGEKAPKHVYLAYPGVDTPQFEVQLKGAIEIRSATGRRRLVSSVVITVDEPQAFLAEWERMSQAASSM